MTKTALGYGNGLGNQDNNLPWFMNFYAGGSDSVRGYKSNSLGPQGTAADGTTSPTGGNILLTQSINFIIPQTINEAMQFSLFVDAGNVFENNIDTLASGINLEGGALEKSLVRLGVGLETQSPPEQADL